MKFFILLRFEGSVWGEKLNSVEYGIKELKAKKKRLHCIILPEIALKFKKVKNAPKFLQRNQFSVQPLQHIIKATENRSIFRWSWYNAV